MRSVSRPIRSRRTLATLAASGGCALALVACGSGGGRHGPARAHAATRAHAPRRPRAARDATASAAEARPPFAVGLRVLHIVDHSRSIVLPGGARRARTITTVVRYPEAPGPFGLIVFGHGFAETPATYAPLLRAWAAAGFVVAAPVFPLENAHAPGGPDERDLVNQPRDMRVVIDRLLGADRRPHGWAAGLIDPRRIAGAGQSDGGETALALAYDRFYRDSRVRAAVLLAGARLPVGGRATLVAHGPPLLAVQGSADPINLPARTAAFFAAVGPPKFLLTLVGATHLAPYTTEQPQLTIVERASTAFLRAYLGPQARRGSRLRALGRATRRPGLATLLARP